MFDINFIAQLYLGTSLIEIIVSFILQYFSKRQQGRSTANIRDVGSKKLSSLSAIQPFILLSCVYFKSKFNFLKYSNLLSQTKYAIQQDLFCRGLE